MDPSETGADEPSIGLIHLARIHSVRSNSDPSSTGPLFDEPETFLKSLTSKDRDRDDRCDDQSWSWMYLKSEFSSRDSEHLFRRYQVRLQHNFFMVLLLLNIVFNIIAIVISISDTVSD